jgi:hypothetical protein
MKTIVHSLQPIDIKKCGSQSPSRALLVTCFPFPSSLNAAESSMDRAATTNFQLVLTITCIAPLKYSMPFLQSITIDI